MKTRFKFAALALIAVAISAYRARITHACSAGAFMPEPIFINTLHPDPQTVTLLENAGPQPTLSYATGNLGVIQPTYASVYLLVAYRNLAGWPIKPDELEALWDSGMSQVAAQPVSLYNAFWQQRASQSAASPAGQDWQSAWLSVASELQRGRPIPADSFIPGARPGPGIFRQEAVHEPWGTYYNQYLNCQQDAFHFAVTTLQRLVSQFGETSPVVQNWVEAQQAVFGDCAGGDAIPELLPATAPAIARDARAYQIAAAHFYVGGPQNYEQAAAGFRAIAQDSSPPWNTVAPYLVARALVRRATMFEVSRPDPGVLAQAEAEINSVLADPKDAEYDHAAEQLRGFIEFRLHPRERLAELANNLMALRGDSNFRQDVTDFKLLFPQVAERFSYRTPPPLSSKRYADLADVRAQSDLLDWMFTLRLGGPEAYAHSFDKWQSTHSQAWLVAALMNAVPDSPHLAELEAGAGQIPPLSKAYDSITFHTLRLLVLQGKDDDARKRLARLRIRQMGYANAPTPPSTVNLFLALRFELAQNLDDLFKNAFRVPATITSGNSSQQMPEPIWDPPGENPFDPSAARLDDDAVMVFNRLLPVALLAKGARSPQLPENVRREIALAAWTRAALLGNAAVARSLSPAVDTFEPDLQATVTAYDSSTTPGAQRFTAVLATLRFPGLRPFITSVERSTPTDQIDDYRDNWWGTQGPLCAPPNPYVGRADYPPVPQWPTANPVLQTIYPGGQIQPPAFLSARDRQEAVREWKGLMDMGPAPDFLSAQVLAWAKAQPSDPRVPEALALAVLSTRLGCADRNTGHFSKDAFDLLHSRYPKSTWTEETKYWFKM